MVYVDVSYAEKYIMLRASEGRKTLLLQGTTLMHIGQRVLQRSNRLGWTQQDLARESDVPQATISRIEQGIVKNPGADVIRRLARALGVTADWLIGMYEEDEEEEADVVA